MPHVKKQLYDFIARELEMRLQTAQRKVNANRDQIRRLAREQTDLKREVREAWRMVAEFKGKAKSEEDLHSNDRSTFRT
jgi:retron-type reverse transcriptase